VLKPSSEFIRRSLSSFLAVVSYIRKNFENFVSRIFFILTLPSAGRNSHLLGGGEFRGKVLIEFTGFRILLYPIRENNGYLRQLEIAEIINN
jgi:hypothetical protein